MIDKVLIITPGFPKDEQDSACVPYLQDYVRNLASVIGSENVIIIAIQYPFTRNPYLWNGIQVFPSGGNNKKSFAYFLTLRRTSKRIKQLFKTNRYIIHAFWMGEAAFIGRNAAKQFNAKLVVTFMGQDVKPGNKAMRYIDTESTKLVTLSEQQGEILQANYAITPDAVIPFPIPEITINPQEYRDIDLLFVGSIIPVKQPEQFIRVVEAVKAKFPNVKAAVAGEGPLRHQLQILRDAKKLNENLKFIGGQSREKIFELMAHAKILVHTSAFEGQCLVYAEALASGMYVVSYAVGRIENTPKHIVCDNEHTIIVAVIELLGSQLNFTAEQFIKPLAPIHAYMKIYTEE